MGRRAAHESVVAILAAFLRKKEWRQVELAESVGVEPRALRRCLETMITAGIPIEHKPAPPHVRWLLPESWLPEAVALSKSDAKLAGQFLSRLKPSSERDDLLKKLLGPSAPSMARADREDRAPSVLRRLEDARREATPVRLTYRSLSARPDASPTTRSVSVHHIEYGHHERLVGVERGSAHLKVYRVDRVTHVELDPSGIFRTVAKDQLDAFIRASIDGFHGGGAIETHAFVVRQPEAAWVRTNLPVEDAKVEEQADGIRVEIATAAPDVLARFVVGLGGAARAETDALRERVVAIAAAALAAATTPAGAKKRAAAGTDRAKVLGPSGRVAPPKRTRAMEAEGVPQSSRGATG